MLKDFAVKGAVRELLKKPLGSVLSEKQFASKKFSNLVTVGDVVSETAVKNNMEPGLIIFDRKVKRVPVDKELVKTLKKYGVLSFKCKNPAGVLTVDSWKTVANALSAESQARLEVKGEEDLLALAVLLLAPSGYSLAYGQPDKGIVLVKITDKLKQEIILKIIAELGKVFMQNLTGHTVVVHDSDTDGCTAATIFVEYLKNRGLKCTPLVTRDAIIHENVQRQIAKLKPDNIIIADLGGEAQKHIRSRSRHMKVMVVDHHRLRANADFGRALCLNPHEFNIPESINPPTAYLAYIICEVLDWVAALGVVADKGHPSCPEFLEKTSRKYKADFERVKDFTNAADVLRDSEQIVKSLLKAGKPQDLMKDPKLAAYEEEFSLEIKRVMAEHKQHTTFYKEAKLVVYDHDTKYLIRGGIANQLQQLYKDHVIIVGNKQGNYYSMSLRTTSDKVDLVKAIGKSTANLRKAGGGGHAKASGCKVLYKDKEVFLERFIRALHEFI